MDEHDDAPAMASADASSGAAGDMDQPQMVSAAASAGAAGLDQHQMASAAASAGAAGLDQPLMESKGKGPTADTADARARVFDVQVLNDLVAQRDWPSLEKQLKAMVSAVDKDGDPVKLHPGLFIIVYQEWDADHIKKKENRAAIKLFDDKVSILFDSMGDFVNENDLKSQINSLHEISDLRATTKATPVEEIQDTLGDYLQLYFADFLENDKGANGRSHLWRFAKTIEKPAGQKNPSFKCLACGACFKNCTISKMRDHLDITAKEKTCPKLTRHMQLRFKEGERQKGQPGLKRLGRDDRSTPSRHAKVGKIGKQNIVMQASLPAVEGASENVPVDKLVEAVHASAESLHIASAGKPLDPKVEERLRAAKNLLDKVLSQKSKQG